MAKHILSCSFGKDSIATALLALQHGEPLDELVYCEVMFSEEISGELPEHNRFIHETAIPYFEQRGIPTRVLRSEKTYLSCFYHVVTRGKTKGMLSGFPLSGRCTIQRDCKLPPIKAYQKALPPDTVQYITTAPCCGKPTTARAQSAATFCCVRISCCSADTSSKRNSYGKTILKLWMNCWPTRKMQKSKSNSLPASAKFYIGKSVSRNVPRGKKKSNH